MIRFTFWAVIAAGVYLLFKFVLAYLFPFFMAFLIASLLNRPIRALTRLLGGKHRGLVAILCLLYTSVGRLSFFCWRRDADF